ncbi:hypothetical protein BABINDRAFT_161654 [Babjeviella inositovora NRRL Y-12698]|uniref:Cystathionine gamma-synthase n=1 Tax=Babjeviella inositovora NRRL Y-12698 TaxID=984486 RepID=A0A1E3QSW3_9ASCO|nr:uncharacterized protein BABINDRAFT_161654 [Babjeviella inositovora NRRL Y-12698]ODQ80007.1 hypothetical protein BABINDRAFT_161654 [Babjeviella inositovora NRRL Y-12698]
MAGFNTQLMHADANQRVSDVTQPIQTSTTYRYSTDPAELVPAKDLIATSTDECAWVGNPVYSRISHPASESCEDVLGQILDGHAVVYNSGLSSFYAMLTHFNPKKLAIGKGYHGCHGIANIFTRISGLQQLSLEDWEQLGPGDILHLESPVNPEGTSFDIEDYANKAHSRGALLLIDSTFAPPPLQKPFDFGVDIIMHSATKYLGGHSDLLAGVLATKDAKVKKALLEDRIFLGTNIANLESYLLLRSLRSFDLRVRQQVKNAEKLVKYLHENINTFEVLAGVYHSSLQTEEFVRKQLPLGGPATFSIEVTNAEIARSLPSKLKYFQHATSLGGVESLIEWRAMSDESVSQSLLRVSVGLEDAEDLIQDFSAAFQSFEEDTMTAQVETLGL